MNRLGRVRYSTVAVVLHWTIALLILWNLYLGLQYSGLQALQLFHLPPFEALAGSLLVFGLDFEELKGLKSFNTLQLHKSVGFSVLFLSALRLLWRLVRKPPPPPPGLTRFEKVAAAVTHWGFYLVMLGLPVTGWIMVSASPINIPTVLFKAVPMPHLDFIASLGLDQRRAIEAQATDLHYRLVNLTLVLLVLHVGAALKHQFLDRDEVVGRMVPLPAGRRSL